MKKIYAAFFFGIMATNPSPAQNWVNGGNSLSANGTIGTNSSHSLLFETSGVERGRITNGGNWAIGSTGTTSRFTVNTPSGVSPFRAQINGGTKLIVGTNGGVSIGTPNAGPANGLYVVGNVGIGIANPSVKFQVQGRSDFFNNTGTTISASNSATGGMAVYASGYTSLRADCYLTDGFAIYSYANASNAWGAYIYSQQAHGLVASTGRTTSYAGFFMGNVYTNGTYSASDEKLKTDIAPFSKGLGKLMQLKVKTYRYHTDGEFAALNLPAGERVGLLAQEVEELFPGLVKQSELDANKITPGEGKIQFKAVNYTELIPVVIAGVQEQQEEIASQKKEIELLREEIALLKEIIAASGQGANLETKTGWIKQNSPNPVLANTTISYFVSPEARAARILLTNVKGEQLKIYNVSGTGTVSIAVGTLPSGTYTYTLVVDGRTISSKKMVIVK